MTMRLAGLFVSLLQAPSTPASPGTTLDVVSGVNESGLATEQWLAMLRTRLPGDRYDSVAAIRKPFTSHETAWATLIGSRVGEWQRMAPGVADLFSPVPAPTRVVIVLGNRGAEDAFTHDARTIGFDLAALQANYGDAHIEENTGRIDRFFRHELTHVMQKPWLQQHPWAAETPLRAALAEIWAEGLGNYQSLSSQWMSNNGRRSRRAAQALAELEPRMVVRLSALTCATPDAARPLVADLSFGRFDRKWGALTAALWLAEEPGESTAALRRFITAGPSGFWELAARHLPEGLPPMLREIRTADSLCAAR